MENKEITIELSNEYLVQFSEKFNIDKKLCVTVPRGCFAIAYINGKAKYKTSQCIKELIISKCGKEYIGQEIQFAFYTPAVNSKFNFGFGDINVNNERLKEAYRVGVNGTVSFSITDYTDLINSFACLKEIKIDDIKKSILSIITSVGVPIVSSCFVNSEISVFEIDSKIDEIRQNMIKKLKTEEEIVRMGIDILSIQINPIFVNEEDLEMIRERINN